MEQALNLDVQPQQPAMAPFPLDDESPTSSPETIDSRANKFKYGLGDILQKTRDEIFQGLSNGEEGNLRSEAASIIDQRKKDALQNVLLQTAKNKGSDLSPEELSGLSNIVSNLSASTNPDTVLETAYGKQFMASLDRAQQGDPNNVVTQAELMDPEHIAGLKDRASTLLAKREILQTLKENTSDELKNQGWLGWGADQAKMMVPGYEDFKLRGLVPGVGTFTGLGEGQNLAEQRRMLHQLPVDDFSIQAKSIVDKLRAANPSIAMEWIDAMLGMSGDDAFVKDMLLPTSLIGTGIGAKVGKGAMSVIRRDAEKAVVDVAKEAANPAASKSTIEAAAGDLKESGITRATANAVADANNVPQATKRAVEALPDTMRVDLQNIKDNPGRLGQDAVNRFEEQTNTLITNLQDVVTNVQKNERLPDVLSNETAVRAIWENMKDTYKGLKNSVIDMSRPYREAVSNTYLVDMRLGNSDGSYFKNRQVAENFADFHGLRDAEIAEGTDSNLTRHSVVIRKLDKQIGDLQKIIEDNQANIHTPEGQQQFEINQGILEKLQIRRAKAIGDQANQLVTVEQQGLGYYIKITKPINETDDVVRSYIAKTKNTKLPDSPVAQFLNSWIGKYRTPEETLSLAERQNRLTTTYAPSEYFRLMEKNAVEINKLQAGRFSKGRQRWEEWQRALENAQELPDSIDPSKKGYFFKDPVDMEKYYLQWFKRLPDEQEIAAYFEFKRGMEMDRIFRNIAEHRNQQRVGAETHRIALTADDNSTIYSNEFSGVQRRKLSSVDNVAIFDVKTGATTLKNLARMSVKEKKELQSLIDTGHYKLIEIYNPELRPLQGFDTVDHTRVRYVLSPTVETRQLDWNQVPRRGGGHVEYDYDWYIKQANMRHDPTSGEYWYEGDTTIMPIQIRAMGKDIAQKLDTVRQLLKAKNETAAQEFSNKNLPMDWDQVHEWFSGKMEDGKFQPPMLNIHEPIQVIKRGGKIVAQDSELEKRYTNFRNGTKEASLARQNQIDYTMERNASELFTLENKGSAQNPLYSVVQADKVDPITTMNRGLARIAKSNFMDDYKTMAVEHWLAQAAKWMEASESEIRHSPFYYFHEAKFRRDAPPELVRQLEAAKVHINQLVGQPSETDALLHSTAQNLADSIYNKYGPNSINVEPAWLMHTLKDPFRLIRSIVFDMKLGLFNIPQFIVQMGNYSNILGVAGYKYAAPGTMAAQLHFWSTVNSHPNIIKYLDNMATKMHLPGTSAWKPGEFTEALKEGQRTGFFNTGGEYAALDSPTQAKVVKEALDMFLDWGRYPFKQGETNAKYGAWYTAYKEFRDANPFGAITPEDRAKILQRADLLNVNMSTASSSQIHKGIWSVPTQFYTYQIRLLELFFGSRLTGKERARMFATNAALYGLPMATGLTGLPAADYIRRKALENGYVVGDNYLTSMLMEGLPSAIGAVVTGGGEPRDGTWYDVGNRFGTKGLEFLGGLDRADKSYMDTIGGPAWSVVKNTIQATDGFRAAMIDLIRGDGEYFPVTAEDIVDPFRQITSVNSVWRTYAAIQGGRAISAKDAYLADTSGAQAMFSAVTGLKDVSIDDIQSKSQSLKYQDDYEKEVEAQFRQEFRRGLMAQKDNNPAQATKFWTRARAWLEMGGYRQDRINGIVNRALQDNNSVLDKINFDFYIKKAPDDQVTTRKDAMKTIIKMQNRKQNGGDQ